MRYVYVISDNDGNCKIGISRNPISRFQTIQNATHRRLAMIHRIAFDDDDAPKVELAVHHDLARNRRAGEWFVVAPDQALATILRVSAEIGVRPVPDLDGSPRRARGRPLSAPVANAQSRVASLLRNARSIGDLNVPGYSVRPASSENDCFVITTPNNISLEFKFIGENIFLGKGHEAS